MNAHDVAAAGKVRRSRYLRAIAEQGMIGTMQAVVIGQMHTDPRVSIRENPLTWNHWTFTFSCAQTVFECPSPYTADARERLAA